MKNMTKISFLVLLLSFALSGCAEKTKGKTVVINNTTTSPVTTGGSGTNTDTDGDGDVDGDDAAVTFYTNLPILTIQGPGTNGMYWSSATNLPAYISPNQFRTDAKFSVRIRASRVTGGTALANSYKAAKACSTFTSNNFSKIQAKIMLRRSGDSLGEVVTVTSDVDSVGAAASFTVPGGTTQPYILEVVEVLTDHRCKQSGGSLYCPYADIPYNSGGPTDCVGLKVEFATDSSYNTN